MTNSKSQLGFDSKKAGPILEILRQVLPRLEKLVEACHDLLPSIADGSRSSLCNSCEERRTCTGSCDKIRKTLPKVNQGRGKRENLIGFYPNTLQPIQKIWLSDVFDQYESCKDIFTPRQWEAIYLYYSQGFTQEQVGTQLGKSRKAISGLLRRAEARKEEHDRKLREEKYKFIKKELKKDED